MKKIIVAFATLATFAGISACSDKDDNPGGGNNNKVDTLSGKYANKEQIKLTAGKTYYLKGSVIFKEGASLTIEPGVVVKAIAGTKAVLIIGRDAKINAAGTVDKPIVFTSNAAAGSRAKGDWGGIVLLGRATVNSTDPTTGKKERKVEGFQAGEIELADILGGGADAPNDEDNSGVLKYARIEFAGVGLSNEANSELNSLTMIGVGRGTTIDHIQSSFGGDDSFEWFGGTVNCKYLVAYRGLDDDFDTDNGFVGKVQFGVSIRDPKVDDRALTGGASNGFESDNDENGTESTPLTAPTFSNMTIIGPFAINNGNDVTAGHVFKRGAHIRRNSRMALYNSVIVGFPTGILLDGDKTINAANAAAFDIRNTYLGVASSALATATPTTGTPLTFNILDWLNGAGKGNNLTTATLADFKFTNLNGDLKTIDARPAAGSPLLAGASFTATAVATGFDKVAYIGAFAQGDTWTNTWTNWDPQNTAY